MLKPRYVDLQDNRIEVPASPTPWEEVTGNASPVVQVQEGLVYFNCEPYSYRLGVQALKKTGWNLDSKEGIRVWNCTT